MLRKRLVLWAPFVICGAMVALLSSRRPWRRADAPRRGKVRAHDSTARRLRLLRAAVVGKDRFAVERLFGPPPTVAGSAEGSTWYYPVDPIAGRALMIHFDGSLASLAQFIETPARR